MNKTKISKDKYRKYCIVPLCKNNNVKNPDKIFLQVPITPLRRRSWVIATGRSLSDFSEKSILFVCEDHFNLEEDMENYIKFKLMGGLKFIKNDVVPHIFNCQPNRERAHSKPEREDDIEPSSEQLIEDAMKTASRTEPGPSTRTEPVPSTSTVEYRETEERICVQVNEQMYRDIAVQVKPNVKHKATQCNMRSKT